MSVAASSSRAFMASASTGSSTKGQASHQCLAVSRSGSWPLQAACSKSKAAI